MANQIVWCDIPVVNLDRAIKFYSAVLGAEVKRQEFSGTAIAILPHNDGEVGGCLFARLASEVFLSSLQAEFFRNLVGVMR